MHVKFGNNDHLSIIRALEIYEFRKENDTKIPKLAGFRDYPDNYINYKIIDGSTLIAKVHNLNDSKIIKTLIIKEWRTDKWYIKKENKKQSRLEKDNLTFDFIKEEEVDGR